MVYDQDLPKLEKGAEITFDQKIEFGDFKADTFIVLDPARLMFRAHSTEGPIVKIVSAFFRIYAWQITSPPVSEPVPTAAVSEPELETAEETRTQPYSILADGQLCLF